jgi:hypothetical protein
MILLGSSTLLAQADATAEQPQGPRRERPTDGERRGFDPSVMRERMATFLRTQFDVTDDAEWEIISERIKKVTELRQNSAENPGGSIRALASLNGGGGGRGGDGQRGGAGAGGGERFGGGGTASPEVTALLDSLRNQASEDKIIAHLEAVRSARSRSEATLTAAQDDLRMVLTPRQEAIAVIAGLLP